MIKIGTDYVIKADQHCWILESRSDGKTREGAHKDVWTTTYHPSIESAARKIYRETLKGMVLESDVEATVEVLEAFTESLSEAIKDLAKAVEKVA